MVSDENSLSQQSDQNRRGKGDADSLDTQLKCLGVLTVHKSVRLYILAEPPIKVNSTPLAQVYLEGFLGVGEISK